tara:strand:- start:11082 stop:11264 length:183 start_codon:yes stop_codon:yes gene_type:complete
MEMAAPRPPRPAPTMRTWGCEFHVLDMRVRTYIESTGLVAVLLLDYFWFAGHDVTSLVVE